MPKTGRSRPRSSAARWAAALLTAATALVAGAPAAHAATTQHPATAPDGSPAAAAQLAAYWTPDRLAVASADSTATDDTYDGPLPGEYIPPSREFDGVPQAGTFFWTDAAGTGRTCSGSAVHSPHRDLVLSAGHCLKGYAGPNPARHLAFVPGYHDGQSPYGVFPIAANGVYVPQQYYALGGDAGAEFDFGFAVTLPNTAGQVLEDAIGRPGYTLLTGTGYFHVPVHMIGYPGGASHTKPIECWSYTARWDSADPADPGSYPRIPCADFIGGTSGGPMTVPLLAPSGWGVFGVIGGLHTGGNTPDVSYSATFGAATRALFEAAVAGAPPAQP